MSTTADIISEVVVSVTNLPRKDISPDANLYLDLGVASVHAMQLLTELEKRFNVAIPDEEYVEATSINSLAALIQKLGAGKDSGCA